MQEHDLATVTEDGQSGGPDVDLKPGSRRSPGGTAKQQAAKPSGGAKKSKRVTVRLQLHLGADTAKRLGVHAAMLGVDKSREADKILRRYLLDSGKGRDMKAFLKTAAMDPDVLPDTGEDRQDEATA
jgi:hypothetical protein